ncbi:ABC transporter permease [Pseudonocardia sp. GCM10023141]|uniref:ABC transporter permease n=1 Tax=Pseudonocardia sp. GCM10023141 TaxID=3252653 RepID=UPI00361F5913
MTTIDPAAAPRGSAAVQPSGPPCEPADQPAIVRLSRRPPILFYAALSWVLLVVVLAALASALPLPDPAQPIGQLRAGSDPSWAGLLGTDGLGRSVLARMIFGARVSLVIGTVAGLGAFVIGTAAGLVAGFYRGPVDTVISYLADALLAFPPLVLLLAMSSVLQPSVTTLLIALAVLMTPTFLRLARANTMSWATREFVQAATNLGARPSRLMVREVLPNLLPALASYLPIVVATLIIAEGSLSFLGLGIPSPTPSWGGMINDGREYIATNPALVFYPAAAIFLTVFALNVLGDRLRARFSHSR